MAHHCHSRKKTSRAKRKRLKAKFLRCREDIFYSFFFCRVVILFAVRLFFCRESFSFCREVFLCFSFCLVVSLFALRLILLLWQSAGPPYLWNSVHKDSWFFSTCGHSWELAQTLLIWLAFIILAREFVDWPVPKMLDIFVCQTSENKAFKTQHSVTVVREERDQDLISSPVFTLSTRSTEHYDHRNNVGRNESSSSENPLGN